jgi:hypothetical protein
MTDAAIDAHPGLAMLVVFSVGVGVGALVGQAIPGAALFRPAESTVERLRRQLCEVLNIH